MNTTLMLLKKNTEMLSSSRVVMALTALALDCISSLTATLLQGESYSSRTRQNDLQSFSLRLFAFQSLSAFFNRGVSVFQVRSCINRTLLNRKGSTLLSELPLLSLIQTETFNGSLENPNIHCSTEPLDQSKFGLFQLLCM